MSDRIQRALKGDRDAMTGLYEANKQQVFGLCRTLLAEEQEAVDTTALIFRKMWEELIAGRINSEEEFADLAVRKARLHCNAGSRKGSTKKAVKRTNDAAEKHTVSLAAVPARLDETVGENIRRVCEPIRKRIQRRTAGIAAAVLIGIGIFVGVLFYAVFKNEDTGIDLTNADPEKVAAAESAAAAASEEAAASESAAAEALAAVMEAEGEIMADIRIADYGTITIQLDKEAAPITVENFVSLAQQGFYDGLTFHRIMENFMMQGGDPNGDGTGGSGKNITGEFSDNGVENDLSHTRGAVSMARANAYDSASSQFFIVHEDSTALDGAYAVFGYVTEGMDVVDAVCESAEPIDGNGTIPAEEQPVMTSVVIRVEEPAAE